MLLVILSGMEKKTLSDLWQMFSKGDPLSDDELALLIRSAEEGLTYLWARKENLAASKTAMDLETLRGYVRARVDR